MLYIECEILSSPSLHLNRSDHRLVIHVILLHQAGLFLVFCVSGDVISLLKTRIRRILKRVELLRAERFTQPFLRLRRNRHVLGRAHLLPPSGGLAIVGFGLVLDLLLDQELSDGLLGK